jgi:hypothetical protein
MAFVIKPLRHEDLDRIYPAGEEEQIKKFTYAKRHWPQDMHGHRWAIDEDTGAFLLRLPMSKDDVGMRYLFGCPTGRVLLRKEGYCLYSFLYVAPSLGTQMDDVKGQIRNAFRAAGEWIDGTTDEHDDRAVPNAQLTPN